MKSPELSRIADIVSPDLPAPAETNILIYILITLLLITAFIIYRYRQSATSQLRQLRRQHQQGMLDNRQLAFRINWLICRRLHLSRISPHDAPAHSLNQNWDNFASRLQNACFSRQGPDNDCLTHLLDEATLWVAKR